MGIPLRSAVIAVILVLVALNAFALFPKPELGVLALLGVGYLLLCLAPAGEEPRERRARHIAEQTGCPLPIARARAVAEMGAAHRRSVLNSVLCC
jgi:hypothetical protein